MSKSLLLPHYRSNMLYHCSAGHLHVSCAISYNFHFGKIEQFVDTFVGLQGHSNQFSVNY